MRFARMLLAVLAFAALAACGSDSIIAPHAAPDGMRRSQVGDSGTEETATTTQGKTTTTTSSDCDGELVTLLTEMGLVVECIARGAYGSGVGY